MHAACPLRVYKIPTIGTARSADVISFSCFTLCLPDNPVPSDRGHADSRIAMSVPAEVAERTLLEASLVNSQLCAVRLVTLCASITFDEIFVVWLLYLWVRSVIAAFLRPKTNSTGTCPGYSEICTQLTILTPNLATQRGQNGIQETQPTTVIILSKIVPITGRFWRTQNLKWKVTLAHIGSFYALLMLKSDESVKDCRAFWSTPVDSSQVLSFARFLRVVCDRTDTKNTPPA